MPYIGETISFMPSAFASGNCSCRPLAGMPERVKAKVTYINEKHRFFRAEFFIWGKPMHECFKY